MTVDSRFVDAALANLLPRVGSHRDEIERALRRHLDDPVEAAPAIGLALASRFPELEGVAAAVWTPPGRILDAAAAGAEADAARSTVELAGLVRSSPTLIDALARAFPQVAEPPAPPLVAVLVGDPELDEGGEPIRRAGRPRWRIPWATFEDRLRQAVDEGDREVRLEVHRATWESALRVVPRAAVVVLLCHGSPEALAFEADRPGRFLHRRLVTVASDLPVLFREARPEIALVLACHGAPAARALHLAGVPLAVAIGEDDALAWDDAADLTGAFLTALLAGGDGRVAFEQAVRATDYPEKFELFENRPARLVARAAPSHYRPASAFAAAGRAFVAREREVAEVVEATARPGLVVVHGAPGQGKTELARAVARRWLLAGPAAEVVAVSLEEAGDGTAMARAVAAQLAEVELVDPTPAEAGAAAGRVRRLVVLDNAEDALAGDRSAFSALVTGVLSAGRASLVVTTREAPIGTWPEHRVTLGPLDPGVEAVELAAGVVAEMLPLERSRARWAELAADAALTGLLADLAGHPLSLRLAAALLATGERPSELRSELAGGRLAHRFLEGDREGSLQGSLELSRARLARLAPKAGELWRIVAGLPGGLPERSAIPDDDADDFRVLRSLALVERTSGGWACLPPVAAYVTGHLPAPAGDRRQRVRQGALAALAGEMRAAADLLGTERAAVGLGALARWYRGVDALLSEPPEVGPALYSLVGAARLARYAGLVSLGRRWCDLAPFAGSGGEAEAGALLVAGELSLASDRLGEAADRYAAALALFEAVEDRLGQANTLQALGDLAVRQARLGEAADRYAAALALFEAVEARLGQANTLKALGDLAVRQDRLGEAADRYAAALALYEAVEARLGQANTLQALGDLAVRQARLGEAADRYAAALALFEAVEARLGQANTLQALGDLAVRQDRLGEAADRYAAALALFEAVEDRLGQANTLQALGDLAVRQARLGEAADRYAAALALFEAVEARLGQANTLRALGDLAVRQARLGEAADRYAAALALFEAVEARLGQANTLRALGDLAVRQDRLGEAADRYAAALALFEAVEARLGQANTLQALGDLAVRQDRLGEAADRYAAALALFEAVEDRLGQANTLQALGDLAVRQARLGEAADRYAAALALFEAVEDRLGQANTLQALGDLAVRQARLGEAADRYAAALALFEAVEARLGQANTLQALGDLAVRQDRLGEAADRYAAALALYEAVEARLGQANTLRALGDLAVRQARLGEAADRYAAALALYEAVEDRLGQANTLQALGGLALAEGNASLALERAGQATGLSLAVGDRVGATGALATMARAHLALDDADAALALLLGARRLARETSMGYNEALVALDLARSLHRAGAGDETAGLVQMAGALLAVRHSAPVGNELRAAAESITPADADRLSTEVDAYLDRLEVDLQLRSPGPEEGSGG